MSDRSATARGQMLQFPTPARTPKSAVADLSDDALLASCGVGESAALGALFDRHHDAVYRLISRLLRVDPAEADDLVQLTFLEVWRAAKNYTGKGTVKSFLYGIAANTVRHHLRSTRRRRGAIDAYAARPEIASANTPADHAVRTQQMARLQRALDELPHDLRAAYVLCDLEDVPGVEAAKILDCRAGTLWRRLHDARRALRDAIDPGGTR